MAATKKGGILTFFFSDPINILRLWRSEICIEKHVGKPVYGGFVSGVRKWFPPTVTPPHVDKNICILSSRAQKCLGKGKTKNENNNVAKQASQRVFVLLLLGSYAARGTAAALSLHQVSAMAQCHRTSPATFVVRATAMTTSESNTNFGPSRGCRLPCRVIIVPVCLFMTWPSARMIGFPLCASDRPMKLPGLLYVKPKTHHYGCPIRVIIRLNSGLGDYGVAK